MTSPAADRLRQLWVSATPLTGPDASLPRRTRWDRVGNAVFWPLAVLLIIHRVAILAVNGSVTDDFTTVYSAVRRFLDGIPVYNETYHHVDPHYLYNPGATLLLSPLGMVGNFDLARIAFIVANAAAIVVALAVLTRLFGFSLRSLVWPASIAAAYLTESVRNTLVFSNINGVLLLGLAVFLWFLLSDRDWWSGLIIGLMILIKPMFAPLLFLPLVKLQWRVLVGGIGVPVLANLVAWPLVPGAGDYVTRLVPYLGEVRDYANSSLAGLAIYFGMPTALETVLWLLFAATVAVGVLVLLRWRYTDPLLWAATTSGLLLAGVFFLSSLGQMYYSMMIFPMFFTLLLRRSVFHTWPAWVAAYLFLSPDSWQSQRWVDWGRWADFFQATTGWGILLLVVATCAVTWWRAERRSTLPAAVEEDAAPRAGGRVTHPG